MTSGITTDTYKKFIIDAGAVFVGFEGFQSTGTLLGATRSGSTITIEQEIKEMEADAARGPVKGSRRIVRVNASISINIIAHSTANFLKMLPGSSSQTSQLLWDAINRAIIIADSDFLPNIALVGETTVDNKPIAIVLKNVINTGNFELNFSDKEEGVCALNFVAHFDPSDMDAEPWEILFPQPAQYLTLLDNLGFTLIDKNGDVLKVFQ